MIPFANRFHGHSSLRYVYTKGQVIRSRFATLKSVENTRRTEPRIAIVISKKVLKSAVRRNRVRRRIYEYIRLQFPRLKQNYDLALIVTSSELLTMPASELATQIEQLLTQSDLYITE
jgi:ribonuclease P protein component